MLGGFFFRNINCHDGTLIRDLRVPTYSTLAPPTNLRSSPNDHLTFKSQVKPRIIKKVLTFSKTIKKNKPKIITFQCKVKTSKHSCKKIVKGNKNKHISKKATFKRKRPKRENIFKPDINDTNNVDDFTECTKVCLIYFI